MKYEKIKDLLSNSNFQNPVIIKTKYGFTKLWEDKGINSLSWGKNWVDTKPFTIDMEVAAELVFKSRLGIN
jgi:hypothetical protein